MKLLDTFNALEDSGIIGTNIDSEIQQNLRFSLRPYQEKVIRRFDYYINNYNQRRYPTHLFFHMATGSGKTLVMAANILQLYKKGYRNFVFISTLNNILEKTKENFLNNSEDNQKYLFSDLINIDGNQVHIKEVDNFNKTSEIDINIHFTSIQALHSKIQNPSEYGLSEDDFENNNIGIIMDESHHINVETGRNNKNLFNEDNWELTINQLLEANTKNILLEFTATMDFDNENIKEKYLNKKICDYTLKEFRKDRYSKEIKTNQTNSETTDRILIAIILSQYKKKVFAHNDLIVKPVVLAKSKTIQESLENKKKFINKLKTFDQNYLTKLRNQDDPLLKKVFIFFDKLNFKDEDILLEIKEDFAESKIISIDTDNESEKNQVLINNLEQSNNPIRLVFAVNKLNEGWDVLNLFDIVRLYDTRDTGKNKKAGKTTIQEAQLIGRGSRYFPFKYKNEDKYKRKFDNNLEDPMRICETLHYHCAYNPRYIDELTSVLKQIGAVEENRVDVELKLKTSFKESKLYKMGFLYGNKKVSMGSEFFQEPDDFNKLFEYQLLDSFGFESTIFQENINEKSSPLKFEKKTYKLNKIKKHIIIKALSSNSFYAFNNLKKYFPKLKSIDDFLGKNYLGLSELIIKTNKNKINKINEIDLFKALKSYLKKVSEEIIQNYGDYQGTKVFYRFPFKQIFKDKTLTAKEGSLTPDTELNVNDISWYAYEQNYGTSEEKFLVRYINDIADKIKKKYKDFFLVRNERFFKLYRFSDGKAFEPDYVMFLDKGNDSKITALQLFIEPKGEPYLIMDDWKEKFLLSIKDNIKFEHKSLDLKIFGLPFYNEILKKKEFEKALFAALEL
jgi:type III restriction enzyme